MWWTVALANPTAITTPAHGVKGSLIVDAPIEAVRAVLRDPPQVAAIDASGTQVKVVGTEDGCLLVDSVSPSAFKTVEYRVRQCATPLGIRGTLVSSNTFDSYSMEWRVSGDGGRTRLDYDLEFGTSMLVPQFVLDRTTRKAVLNLLTRLQAHLEPAATPR